MDVHDIKTLMVMTLYGLPFVRFQAPTPLPFPSEEAPLVNLPAVIDVPPIGLVERTITFTLEIDPDNEIDRTDAQVPLIESIGVEDSFVQSGLGTTPEPRIIEATQEGLPDIPEFAYNLSLSNTSGITNLIVRDVSFIGGSYQQVEDYEMQISQVISQDIELLETTEVPTFTEGVGLWFPDPFYEHTSTSIETENGDTVERTQLLVNPAQFRASDPDDDDDGAVGDVRYYNQMVFRVIYFDPTAERAAEIADDVTAPTLQVQLVESTSTTPMLQQSNTREFIVAQITNEDNLDGVTLSGSYTIDNANWRDLQFERLDSNNTWTAPLPNATDPQASVSYFVQAQDAAAILPSIAARACSVRQKVFRWQALQSPVQHRSSLASRST
ncbi:MAG: hypothetical protein HC893_01895 [Chloroflexaceae bacterium]|nr:hypothetical protein [Chloroflexaceae bacterium]